MLPLIAAGITAVGAGYNVVRNMMDDSGEIQERAVPVGLTPQQQQAYQWGSGDVNWEPVMGSDGQPLVDPNTGQPVMKPGTLTALGKEKRDLDALAYGADKRKGATVGMSGTSRGAYGNYIDSRDAGLAYGQTLRDQMAGKGPSLAQIQLQRGLDASNAQAMSMAAGARGGAAMQALAQRQAMTQAGANNIAIAQEAGLQRAREQLQAQQEYRALIEGMNARDLSHLGAERGIDQYNASLEDAQRARNDQAALAYRQLRLGLAGDDRNAKMSAVDLQNMNNLKAQGANLNIYAQNAGWRERKEQNTQTAISTFATAAGGGAKGDEDSGGNSKTLTALAMGSGGI